MALNRTVSMRWFCYRVTAYINLWRNTGSTGFAEKWSKNGGMLCCVSLVYETVSGQKFLEFQYGEPLLLVFQDRSITGFLLCFGHSLYLLGIYFCSERVEVHLSLFLSFSQKTESFAVFQLRRSKRDN